MSRTSVRMFDAGTIVAFAINDIRSNGEPFLASKESAPANNEAARGKLYYQTTGVVIPDLHLLL